MIPLPNTPSPIPAAEHYNRYDNHHQGDSSHGSKDNDQQETSEVVILIASPLPHGGGGWSVGSGVSGEGGDALDLSPGGPGGVA